MARSGGSTCGRCRWSWGPVAPSGTPTAATDRLLAHVSSAGGWQVPEHPRVVVDADYVLAAAGLLSFHHPAAAHGLLRSLR